jgi:hypothetical protein
MLAPCLNFHVVQSLFANTMPVFRFNRNANAAQRLFPAILILIFGGALFSFPCRAWERIVKIRTAGLFPISILRAFDLRYLGNFAKLENSRSPLTSLIKNMVKEKYIAAMRKTPENKFPPLGHTLPSIRDELRNTRMDGTVNGTEKSGFVKIWTRK